jgi:SAM-dependent methyltransferase
MDDYPPVTFDITAPQVARVWNYWLGGKDHFAVDREFGDQYSEVYPEIIKIARACRGFLSRAVDYLAGEAGIRQFLDIGTGLPTANNTHEVAQRVASESRVVYVDNDPLVLVHARALLTGTREGATAYLDADVREPEKILSGAAETLDFDRPIALMLLGIMGNVADINAAYAIVDRLVGALPPGSYLALTDGTHVLMDDELYKTLRALNEGPDGSGYHLRTPEEIARFFDGLELLEPGVVSTPLWRPEPDPAGSTTATDEFCGVGRKP